MKKILLLTATIFCFLNLINAQPGQLDPSFGTNGIVKTDLGDAGKATYYKEAIQKDGKIIALGNAWNGNGFDFVIVRYNTNGSLDTTFGGSGILTTGITSQYENSKAFSIAIQKDGKIVVSSRYAIFRYTTDGSLDFTFSGDGKLTTESNISIGAVAVQSDGKILAAGAEEVDEETGNPAVLRYNSNGSLDKTFGVTGKQTLDGGGFISSIVIQKDGKIVVAGIYGDFANDPYAGSVFLARLDAGGSVDSTFADNGKVYPGSGTSCSAIVQNDGKIVVAGNGAPHGNGRTFVSRYNINGSIDSSFNAHDSYKIDKETQNTSLALQTDGKIVVLGIDFLRLNTDGSWDSTFNTNAAQEVDFTINDIAISNDKLYAAGGNQYGSVARYLLDNSSATPPTVTLTSPANNTTRLAPAAHIKLSAVAADKDGTITKVEFYKDSTLLHTETVAPYGYVWRNVGLGNYTLTAKAYDNSGLVTTSAPVHISVVPNKAPVVSIITPSNNQSFAAPAYIHFEAAASDSDGRITNVKFYNGSTLLRTEYKSPYTYVWKDVPGGTYTITAVATDNWGAQTTSAPVIVRVTSPNTPIVSSRPIDNKTGIIGIMDIKLAPNPATSIVNIYTAGLQQDKQATISIISASGIVMKTIRSNSSDKIVQLDVSSLVRGVYTIKITSGNKMTYKQFVKL